MSAPTVILIVLVALAAFALLFTAALCRMASLNDSHGPEFSERAPAVHRGGGNWDSASTMTPAERVDHFRPWRLHDCHADDGMPVDT